MGVLIERTTTTGPVVVAGDVRVTPESSVVIMRLPFGAFVWNRPSAVVVERGGRVERLPIHGVTRIFQIGVLKMIDTFGGVAKNSHAARELSEKAFERIYAAAQPGAVFSPPVTSGEYTIITASEVAAGGGFGFGEGSNPTQESAETSANGQPTNVAGGGGGGGGSMGRPVAAIVIGPDGVKVQPIVDATKIALAAIGAWLSIAFLLVRRARATKS
jgi:uncharacterized spore protein YtfJ